MLRYALFDLDNTLYPADAGVWGAISERINLFMTERLRLPPAEAVVRRRSYLHAFGTTLNGLRQDFGVDAMEYLAFVHDLPLDRYLHPAPALDAMLARLPLVKVIFTNADERHAGRVLDCLGIRRHFARIIDIVALDFVNKPEPAAYRGALQLLGANAAECVFVDDMPSNLLPAHDLGMCTVLVGVPSQMGTHPQVGVLPQIGALPHADGGPAERAGASEPGVDHHIANILELENLLAAPCRSAD